MGDMFESFRDMNVSIAFRSFLCFIIIILIFMVLYKADLYFTSIYLKGITAQDRLIIGSKILKLTSLLLILIETMVIFYSCWSFPRDVSVYRVYSLWLLFSAFTLGGVMVMLAYQIYSYWSGPEHLPTAHYGKEHDEDYPWIFAANIGSMLPILMFLLGNIFIISRHDDSAPSHEQIKIRQELRIYVYLIDGPAIAGTMIVYVVALYGAHYYKNVMSQLIFTNGAISFLVFSNFIASFFAKNVVSILSPAEVAVSDREGDANRL